jgi:hypothetical protein
MKMRQERVRGHEMPTIEDENPQPPLKYRRVESSTLPKGRRGKHHDLIRGILGELATTDVGSALKVPLDEIGGIGLANLRSAVHRAAKTESLSIETLADQENFYVWKTIETKIISGGRVMQQAQSYPWEKTYLAAILETDNAKLRERVEAANASIVARMDELRSDSGGTAQEQKALADALNGLKKLETERLG